MPTQDQPDRIEIIARGLMVSGGAVLLCRDRKHGHAYLPGGHVEPGELAAAALARELQEEAGLGDVTIGRCLRVEEQRFMQRGTPRHELSIVFHVELPDRLSGVQPPIAALEPQLAFEWAPINQLDDACLLPASIAQWIRRGVDLDKTCWQGGSGST